MKGMDTREVVMGEATIMAAGVVVGGMVTMALATVMDTAIAVVATTVMGIIMGIITESRSRPRHPPENRLGSP